jgi:sialidase-1
MNRRFFLKTAGVVSTATLLNFTVQAGNPENKVVLDLEPSGDNFRNSEGAFVTLKSGRIIFVYTHFEGGEADDSPAQLVSIHSDDGGESWSQTHRIVVQNPPGLNVMSASLLRLQSGKIALFYLAKNSLLDCRPVMRISTDECETWSESLHVGDAPGYFVLNNDRVIQLQDGRLVAPVAFHRACGSDPKSQRSLDLRAIALWYWSQDEGKTWHEADDWWALPARSQTGFQEPGVVELADGRLFSWMRTDQGTQFGSYSSDGGKRWSSPERTELQSPASPASIKRLPGSSNLLALYNDHSGKFPFTKGKRTPLVAAISSDGAKTWPKRKLVENDPNGSYCYTSIHFTETFALLAYSAGDEKIRNLNRLRLRRVSLDWLNDV